MKVVIPLAGPDFIIGSATKAQRLFKGSPLLRTVLESRPWWQSGQVVDQDLIFVLQDHAVSRRFKRDCLSIWYPSCRVIFLTQSTRGAALSATAAMSLLENFNEIVCVDLADIYFDCDEDPVSNMILECYDAVALTFESEQSEYSYLKFNATGEFLKSAEKQVISQNASAGVYFFINAAKYLSALAYLLSEGDRFLYNQLYYICPMLNGVKSCGGRVGMLPVTNVHDIKLLHNES